MLPVMKKTASGDHARSYISEPDERHMCLIRHVSLSSKASSPNICALLCKSEGTHNSVLPSSPAVANISPDIVQCSSPGSQMNIDNLPRGAKRTTLTACVCCSDISASHPIYFFSILTHTFVRVVRYMTVLSSPSLSTFHKRTLLSPPPVASRPLPCGSKWAEYIGVLSLCHEINRGEAFIALLQA